METDVMKGYYEEVEPRLAARVAVRDAARFIKAMCDLFRNNGTLYISSYDFGYWAERLASFRSGERVRLQTSLPDPAFLENGFSLTDEFIYVFSMECLANVDARTMFNQFLIYRKGSPVLQCCCNFDDVFVSVRVPQKTVDALLNDGVITEWNKL